MRSCGAANPLLEIYLKATTVNKIKDFHRRMLTVIVFIIEKNINVYMCNKRDMMKIITIKTETSC